MADAEDVVWEAFDGRPHGLRMGLRALDLSQWTVPWPSPRLGSELDRKAALLRRDRASVLAAAHDTGGLADAADEFAQMLVGHLVTVHGERYALAGGELRLADDGRTWDTAALDPLELAGRIVTEDWCLVRPAATGGPLPPVFVAGAVFSPNRWRLADKLGGAVTDVHDPVPGYARRLGTPVDAILAKDHSWWRRNWSILSSSTRFQPVADGPRHPEVPDGVWVRSEYETLVRLPRCGWWVFGIQTSIRRLSDLATRPDDAARVATAVASLDAEMAAYKSLEGWQEPLLAWLQATARGAATRADGLRPPP